jgi:hypothetical protein
VRRRILIVDLGIAAVVAIVVLIVSPGLAVAGLIAVAVLLVCAITWLVDVRRWWRGSHRSRRAPRQPPRRPPPRRPSRPL